MKVYGGSGSIGPHFLLTWARFGGEGSASWPGRFTPGERAHGTPLIGGWVNPRAGLDDVEKEKIVDPTGTRTPTEDAIAAPRHVI
jgi:hypothetical protein